MRTRVSRVVALFAVLVSATSAQAQNLDNSTESIARLPSIDSTTSVDYPSVTRGQFTYNQLLTSMKSSKARLVNVSDNCTSCGSGDCGGGCGSCCDAGPFCADCDDCPTHVLNAWTGFDAFKGLPDGTWQDNFGVVTGLNYGTRLGRFSELTGIGAQFGGSYGVYDWNGRNAGTAGGQFGNQTQAQTQMFITTGFFRQANEGSKLSGGLVYDWMINQNYGVFATSPTLGQWRAQIAYAFNGRNEIGVYSTVYDKGAFRTVGGGDPVDFRSYNQTNVFWHHLWESGLNSWIYIGAPNNTFLGGNGSLGQFILGTRFIAPLGDRWGLYGNGQYMFPSATPGGSSATENAWNVGFGLVFYPAGNSRTRTVSGSCWAPYMPVANNSTFLVDTSLTN